MACERFFYGVRQLLAEILYATYTRLIVNNISKKKVYVKHLGFYINYKLKKVFSFQIN